MGREVPFYDDAVCDGCGAIGAYDFMGDCYCQACTDRFAEDASDALDDFLANEGKPSGGQPDADDRSNSISPAYGAWEDFARRTELYALFFGQGWIDATERYRGDERHHRPEQPILKSHPGATLLTAEDHHEVQQARARFRATVQGSALYEADQKRLAWLDFWMGWALANCKTPVIANS